ncbi:MAG: GNAT family N-acetyltransferase [Bacteroidia bacterium]
MEIQHEEKERNGLFFVAVDGEILAKLIYRMSGPGKMIIDHTEVDERLAGKGIGKQLVAKAVAFARENNIKILPLCPFAKALFDKTPEYRDVLF